MAFCPLMPSKPCSAPRACFGTHASESTGHDVGHLLSRLLCRILRAWALVHRCATGIPRDACLGGTPQLDQVSESMREWVSEGVSERVIGLESERVSPSVGTSSPGRPINTLRCSEKAPLTASALCFMALDLQHMRLGHVEP